MKQASKKWFFMVVLLFAAGFQAANAHVLTGIPESGSPNYTNSVKVRLFDLGGQFLLNAQGVGQISVNGLGLGSFTTTSSVYSLSATFNSNGSYVSGSGTLTASGTFPFGTLNLITARLTNFNYSNDLLGFSTAIDTGFATLFGTNESVYFHATGLGSLLGFVGHSLVANTAGINASAITTIPVPAAAWLFVSGLGLLGLRRKVA